MASKLHPCKSCGKEIAVSARSCPNCGQKLKGSLVVGILKWAFIVFAALVVLGMLVGRDGEDGITRSGSRSTASDPPLKVGEAFLTGKFEVAITAAGVRNHVGNSFFYESPSEGAVFVVVHSSVKNISET